MFTLTWELLSIWCCELQGFAAFSSLDHATANQYKSKGRQTPLQLVIVVAAMQPEPTGAAVSSNRRRGRPRGPLKVRIDGCVLKRTRKGVLMCADGR
jgi:hypothetical protein